MVFHEGLQGVIIDTDLRITNMHDVPDQQERIERIIEILRLKCIAMIKEKGEDYFKPKPPIIAFEFSSPYHDKGPIFAYRSIDDVDFNKIMAREVIKVDQSKNVLKMVDTPLNLQIHVYKTIDDVRMPQISIGTGKKSPIGKNPFILDEAELSGTYFFIS